MLLDIELLGSSHDNISWPKATIILNGCALWDGEIVKEIHVQKEIELTDENLLEITHYGKSFGENRQWHTKLIGDKLFDRNIVVKKIMLGSVDIIDLLHLGLIHNKFNDRQLNDFVKQNINPPYIKQLVHQEQLYMGYNSTYQLKFPRDVYDWIIVHKTPYMRPFDPNKQSSLNSVNWRLDWVNSKEIKDLIDELDELIEAI